MDAGAHFFRCDFQVHTPRDINWTGDRPVSDEDRKAWAERFVRKCREKRLHAVAITDHHDMVFVEAIRVAAKEERDDEGDPYPEQEQLTVFPGMEMTLSVPCQALLLLDANFPGNMFPAVMAALGIASNDAGEDRHAETQRLTHIDSLSKMCEILDVQEYARGRYIILPNVGKGQSSILRKAFAPKYKEMPCVGGYLDGSETQLDDGKRRILDGKDTEWGFKPLGLFQTSDDRFDDRRNLGTHSTWVKWAQPTAEALRQACLARQTRLHQTEPQLPAIAITSLEVSNSTFLGPIDIEFNPQFSCLIGGRGTGKSSVLEYLRWALCDHPPMTDSTELPDYQAKRVGLVKNTLAKVDGIATVTFVVNGIQHVVQRKATTESLQLKIADGNFEDCVAADVEKLLPIQAYSQKQLSAVGVRTDELIRLVKAPIEAELAAKRSELRDTKDEIRASHEKVRLKRDLSSRLERLQVEESSLALQVVELRKQLTGLSEADAQVLSQHENTLTVERHVSELTRHLESMRAGIQAAGSSLKDPPDIRMENDESESLIDELARMHAAAERIKGMVSERLGAIEAILQDGSDELGGFVDSRAKLNAAIAQHNERYEAAKERSTANTGKLTLIESVEKQVKSIRQQLADTREELQGREKAESEYESALVRWKQLHAARAVLLSGQCDRLTQLSAERIRATLAVASDASQISERLTKELSGTRVRSATYEALCSAVTDAQDPLDEWLQLVEELESLAAIEADEDDDISVPGCPRLVKAGATQNDLERIARKLTPAACLELLLTSPSDVPVFEYQRRENDYIPFASASAGQQATALLKVLLNQDGPPLIIDQPEDDLDNQVILDIVEQIWSAKAKRQIIVSSHNANIVVNGDADLVICCDYRRAGDHSGGRIKCHGAIDVEQIRDEIKHVMEGGEKAFQLRKAKYGF